jgi:uncharacterized protein YceK
MSARGVQLACVGAVLASASACGTLDNVRVRYPLPPPAVSEPPNQIYGGVTADAKEFWGLAKLGPLSIVDPWFPVYVAQLFGSFIDIPFSAVGDTLTLPVTISATIKRDQSGSGRTTPQAPAGNDIVQNEFDQTAQVGFK